MTSSSQPATLVTSRLVRAGHQDEFAAWAKRFDAAASGRPGHLLAARLEQPNGLVHFLHHFTSGENVEQWRDSLEHKSLVSEADRFSVEQARVAAGRMVQQRLPSETAVPKWKTFLATWSIAFPFLLVVNAAIDLIPFDLPELGRLALTSLILIASLTWLILPRVKKLLRPWLFDDGDGGLREDPS